MQANTLLIMGPKGVRKGVSFVELCTWVLAAVLPGFKSSFPLWVVCQDFYCCSILFCFYKFLTMWKAVFYIRKLSRRHEIVCQA